MRQLTLLEVSFEWAVVQLSSLELAHNLRLCLVLFSDFAVINDVLCGPILVAQLVLVPILAANIALALAH